ncbi:MAG: type II toxin-antitoxin system RelE/ParE family toxin, partial [Lachnospiraceae bacterium]|nr:type II toxin-antitoxin system RelE/ParE family toxin [Lachnospiraceae bacterium]
MYDIEFFEDANGYSEIVAYIKDLEKRSRSSKECRVNYNKIIAYFDLLQERGVMIGEPMTKHIEGSI